MHIRINEKLIFPNNKICCGEHQIIQTNPIKTPIKDQNIISPAIY